MNSIDTFAALAFAILAVVMLVHRLVWPVYALTSPGGLRRRLFGVVGVALLGCAGMDLPNLLKQIIETFAG